MASYPINLIHLCNSGPVEAYLQIQLKPTARMKTAALKERLIQGTLSIDDYTTAIEQMPRSGEEIFTPPNRAMLRTLSIW